MRMLRGSQRWLVTGALVLLTPAFLIAHPGKPKGGCSDDSWRNDGKNCQAVPEGGSSAGYLLALGVTCLGAMFVRSRLRNTDPS